MLWDKRLNPGLSQISLLRRNDARLVGFERSNVAQFHRVNDTI